MTDCTTAATTQVTYRATVQEMIQPAALAKAFPVSSEWEAEAFRATLALKDLPDTWEASASPRPTIVAINGALECIGNVAGLGFEALTAPFVAPMADGGVQLEWDHGDCHLEIEVQPDGTIAYVLRDRSEIDAEDFRGTASLRRLFGRLMAVAR